MSQQHHDIFEFGPFRVDAQKRLLFRAGEPLKLFPKEFDTLLALVQQPGVILDKDQLMRLVWGTSVVEEGTLTTNISHLRKILGEKPNAHQYIVTVPGQGYRFVADVRTHNVADPVAARAINVTRPRLTAGLAFVVVVVLGVYLWVKPPQAPSIPQAHPQIRSIAVLPFRPLVATARDEALEMGIAETLITTLSYVREVVVRPMSAVRRYAALEQDAIAAGREQRVDAVLDGNIQKVGDSIRVTVRLLRIEDGAQIWADKFDQRFADVFTLQDAIARRVTEALSVKLTGEERQLLAKRYTDNTAAYQLYIVGRSYWSKITPETSKKGIEYFEQAIEKDPDYALAYAGVADAYQALARLDVIAPKDAFPKAKAAAIKALKIDEGLAEAHTALAGVLADYDWDWVEAERHNRRAIELSPNDPRTHHGYSSYLAMMARFDEAIAEATRARDLDPLSPLMNTILGRACYQARRFDQAMAHLQTALELDRNFDLAHFLVGLVHLQHQSYEEAISAFQRSRSVGLVGYVYARSGRRNEALSALAEVNRRSQTQYVPRIVPAIIYAGLGDKSRAFEFLDKAYQNREWHVRLLKVDPLFDDLRSDPRFIDLLRRAGLLDGVEKAP